MRSSRVLRILFWGWVAFVVAASLLPAGTSLPRVPINDKLGHFASYAVLALLGTPLVRSPGGRALLWLSIVGLGGALEALQTLVPGRTAEGGDLAADALGAVAGVTVCIAILTAYSRSPMRRRAAANRASSRSGSK